MVSDFILKCKEFWVYEKLKLKFKDSEIAKLDITITRDNFTYSKKKSMLDFSGETIRFPNIISLLIWNLVKTQLNNKKIHFERSEAKGMDMMFIGPASPGRETYVYHLRIKTR